MSQYATVDRVKANLPSKRSGSVDDDGGIRIEIEQASAWVDSLYSDVAPFPSVGPDESGNESGTFTELYVAEDSIEGVQVSIESAPALLNAGVELMFGTRLDLDDDPTVDYSIYKLAEDVLEDATSITLNRAFDSESSGNGGRRTILAGTPPLIRLATELMTRFNILTSGPNANTSKDISSLELRAAKLLNATVQVMSIGNVIEGPAYAEPHPRINIFRQSAPRDLTIILAGSITTEVNNDVL